MQAAPWLLPACLVLGAAVVKLVAMSASVGLHRVFLYPLALLLAVFAGESFSERDGLFYFSDFFLDFSCAGINFFVIVVITTALLTPGWDIQYQRVPATFARMLSQLCLRLIAVFVVTLAANFTRVALYLNLQAFAAGRAWLHEAVGITVFLSILICYSLLLYRINNAKQPANP